MYTIHVVRIILILSNLFLQISVLECKIERQERDKQAMGNLLVSRREDYERKEKENDELIEELGDRVSKLESGQWGRVQDFSLWGRGGQPERR